MKRLNSKLMVTLIMINVGLCFIIYSANIFIIFFDLYLLRLTRCHVREIAFKCNTSMV